MRRERTAAGKRLTDEIAESQRAKRALREKERVLDLMVRSIGDATANHSTSE